MKNLLLDLWNDLREKRLWPVAVVLLLGLVAVPVVLSKPADQSPAPTVAASARKAPEPRELKRLTAVKLDEGAVDESSPLNTFDPANPFRPPAAVIKRTKDDGTDLLGGATTDPNAVTGGAGAGGEPSSGGTTGQPTNPGTSSPQPTVTEYEWVIDVTFARDGKSRRIKKLVRLDMLPGERDPLLIFLGVTAGGGSAVFLVDSTLTAAGEGTCQPSDDACALVYLGAGAEHSFTNDQGDSYTLRVNEIRKVKLDPKKAKLASTGRHAKRPRAGAAVGASRHRFVPQLISDLVSVSSADAEASTPDSDRR